MTFMDMAVAFAQISPSFSFAPFADILQPMIDATLAEQGKEQYRQGTLLTPCTLSLAGIGSHLASRPQLSSGTQLDDIGLSLDTGDTAATIEDGSGRGYQSCPSSTGS
jgi:hypothetical protein